jgi:hypothetical protein
VIAGESPPKEKRRLDTGALQTAQKCVTEEVTLSPANVNWSRWIDQPDIEEIRQLHDDICRSAQAALNKAVIAGGKLTTVRSRLKHGQWLPFCKHIGISDQTARNYMRLWEHRDQLKSKSVLNLTEAYAAALPPKKTKPEPISLDDRMQHALRLDELINSLVRVAKMFLYDWGQRYGDDEEKLMLKIECGLR